LDLCCTVEDLRMSRRTILPDHGDTGSVLSGALRPELF
jgi:hypothetical protein